MTKATRLIRKLARELKYLPLPELFGREVMIHGVDTGEHPHASQLLLWAKRQK